MSLRLLVSYLDYKLSYMTVSKTNLVLPQYIGAANILLNQCEASSPALPVSETRDEEGRN